MFAPEPSSRSSLRSARRARAYRYCIAHDAAKGLIAAPAQICRSQGQQLRMASLSWLQEGVQR
jgi:hypothetical protein